MNIDEMADALARRYAEERGWSVEVRSAGTRAIDGQPAAPNAVKAVREVGADLEVPTLGGPKVRLRVPSGTPNGRTFRVRGKGVRKANGDHGDLLVTVEVQVPSSLSAEAEAALRKYADVVGSGNPRAGLFG